jgi:hypothetical protein
MPLPAHSTSADHPVVPCNAQFRYPLSLVTILSGCEINNFAGQSAKSVCYNLVAMFDLFRLWLGVVLRLFRTRRSLMLENLALRQQLAVFKRQQPRPRLGATDKLFWVVARRFWAHWKKALLIVLPDTVARWHRSGFKLYWAMLCKVPNRDGRERGQISNRTTTRGSPLRMGARDETDESEQQAPSRHRRPAPAFRILCFSRSSGLLSNYFGLCSEPIFEMVTAFTAPFLVRPICTPTNYILGQFEGAFVGLRG